MKRTIGALVGAVSLAAGAGAIAVVIDAGVARAAGEAAPAAVAPAAAAPAPKPLALGAKAPLTGTKMKGVDGKPQTIAGVAGKKGTLVVFTCNHCPFAKAWEQRIVDLGNGYSKKGIGVILINANDPSKYAEDDWPEMQKRAKALGMQIPYVVDDTSAVARAFGATVTPEAFLFGADGKLVYHGTIDDNRDDAAKVEKHYLRDALDAALGGKPPSPAETKSLGCGIKFRQS